ncbi:hypothetical protein ACTFIV_009533 [Dictyostelium citrinum]
MKLLLSLLLLLCVASVRSLNVNWYYFDLNAPSPYVSLYFDGPVDSTLKISNIYVPQESSNSGTALPKQTKFFDISGNYYDISSLVLPSNTQNPYNVRAIDVAGYKYTYYFNFADMSQFCKSKPNSGDYQYQSCLIGDGSNSNVQAGSMTDVEYNVQTPNLLKLKYKATQSAYGCVRNTLFELSCDPTTDITPVSMSIVGCNYVAKINSKYACSTNPYFTYTFTDAPNVVKVNVDPSTFTSTLNLYINNEYTTLYNYPLPSC